MKPKAQITLEDLKTICTETGHSPCLNAQCTYYEVCPYRNNIKPRELDLTDPPRFTEAQMALMKALWDIGARFLARDSINTAAFSERPYFDAETAEWLIDESDSSNAWIFKDGVFGIAEMEVLDLAELFGKEGADAK